MAENSKADYLKAAEIMAMCGKPYVKYAVYFLEKSGVCEEGFIKVSNGVGKNDDNEEERQRGRRKTIDPEFVALLNEMHETLDAIVFDTLLKRFRSNYGIQKERFFSWMRGETGISDELRGKLEPEIRDAINVTKNSHEIINAIRAMNKKKEVEKTQQTEEDTTP